jgi:hypothetical protein
MGKHLLVYREGSLTLTVDVTIYTTCFKIQKFCTLSTQCVHVFAVIIAMNNDYGPEREEACSL